MSRTIVDIHVLQTVPPSNINRDDTGSPKTAVYGGVRRARVSSQAWKRATRVHFQATLDPSEVGMRTKRVAELVAEQIVAQAPKLREQANDLATKVLTKAGIKMVEAKAKKGADVVEPALSGYLLFLSARQAHNLAALAVTVGQSADQSVALDAIKGEAKAAADSEHSIDIALFGRMVADQKDLGVDASAQVAHAISVHAVENEFDYFTAIDDRSPEDQSGAGMIGTVEFNSSTLYRYATVDVNALQDNLGSVEATAKAVKAFVTSFVRSMPTGKQNTFANRTLPEGVVVIVRDSQPINLVQAFESAVTVSSGQSRVSEACNRLACEAQEIDEAYGEKPVAILVNRHGEATDPLGVLGKSTPLPELVEGLAELVEARLRSGQSRD
jgi:CRISPR system Cascade subunit CasC